MLYAALKRGKVEVESIALRIFNIILSNASFILKSNSMKKTCYLIALLLCGNTINAQSQNLEKEIRNLEQIEVKAVLEKDSTMLLKLWDKEYVVNSPDNVIVFPGKSTLDRPVMKRSRTSFSRNTEQVVFKGDMAFAMGSETVVTTGDQSQAGQTIKRRYTNVWMKKNSSWKLVARHANIICR
ncbi:YybH family protein [Hymenobacter sp. HDW8]|uniref:YybH family protein n=1 Tax=Hymenobacter sp. HDW8 TaxID=2714932 RepID=UPI00140804C6|nr:nuclear transport factor 2 family protein [Hymenobacter sp. HDW8]QIL75422.1 nuclear transport factor 2 family protein [Hymenobacter sp. HDW8]